MENKSFLEHPGNPLPKIEGHFSQGRFERVLREGHFAVTTELAPPDSGSADDVYERAAVFDGAVDAINATDGSGANCHMSSLSVCSILSHAGYSPILQISCRDKNRIAIQGDILGASAMGICNVLSLTGDDVFAGDHPEAKPVFDLDSISLLTTISTLRDKGHFLSGRKIINKPNIFAGSSINPFVPPIESRVFQLQKKVSAGASFVQSQYCFDIEMLKVFMKQAEDLGLTEKVFILIGVGVLASANTAKWLVGNVPGVHIPDHIISRLAGAEDQKLEGRNICIELMQQVKEISGVSGVHVMAYKQEHFVKKIVEKSGVLEGRIPWSPEKKLTD